MALSEKVIIPVPFQRRSAARSNWNSKNPILIIRFFAEKKIHREMPTATYYSFKRESEEDGVCEFQTKWLYLDSHDAVFTEFSCGCSFKTESVINHRGFPIPSIAFLDTFKAAMTKFFKSSLLRKTTSLWKNEDFEKTPHQYCPADPAYFDKMYFILWTAQREVLEVFFRVFADPHVNCSSDEKCWTVNEKYWEKCSPKKKIDTIWFLWLPNLERKCKMPVELAVIRKNRRLPKKAKEALQVDPNTEEKEPLSDTQLVDLFEKGSFIEKKQKPSKKNKKPNNGKAPNAIRKTKKPARL